MAAPRVDVDAIGALIVEVSERVIVPRFRALAAGDVSDKGPDDVVTVADTEAEELITAQLLATCPGVPVIGEEAVAADPRLVENLDELATYWLLDPLDGTANFVAGDPAFGVMLALVHRRETVASWILLPVPDRLYVAELGSGAFVDGERVPPRPLRPPGAMRAWLSTRYLPSPWSQIVARNQSRFAEVSSGPGSAASAYTGILDGDAEVGLLWRTQPWDHAPGALLLREAGGAARRFDGSDYRPGDDQSGLLLTADADSWGTVSTTLLG